MALPNGSYASPLANAKYPIGLDQTAGGFFSRICAFNGYSLFAITLLLLVGYDQCRYMLRPFSAFVLFRTVKVVIVQYIWKKKSIIGPAWKFPFAGPFLESVFPKMDVYKAKWASGDLSCVSVFHK